MERTQNDIMKKASFFFLAFIVSAALISVQTGKSQNSPKKLIKALKFGYSFVPSQTVEIKGESHSVQSFFMLNTEVSNMHYKEYLSHLKNNVSEEVYQAALPDFSRWELLDKSISFGEAYFNAPAFREYPVVNVSQEQALRYCEWLTTVLQEKTADYTLRVRLPLRAEFLSATNNSLTSPYAWKESSLTNKKGEQLCNYREIPFSQLTRDEKTGGIVEVKNNEKVQHLTAPVKSYSPNEYGLYNLNGNVAEWIIEPNVAMGGDWTSLGYDVRNESEKLVEEAHPTVGFRVVITYKGN